MSIAARPSCSRRRDRRRCRSPAANPLERLHGWADSTSGRHASARAGCCSAVVIAGGTVRRAFRSATRHAPAGSGFQALETAARLRRYPRSPRPSRHGLGCRTGTVALGPRILDSRDDLTRGVGVQPAAGSYRGPARFDQREGQAGSRDQRHIDQCLHACAIRRFSEAHTRRAAQRLRKRERIGIGIRARGGDDLDREHAELAGPVDDAGGHGL